MNASGTEKFPSWYIPLPEDHTYKLIYFDMKGLAEPVRFMLCYLGKDFEDVRMSFQEWKNMKKDVPFGKLPVLEIGDKRLYQSTAIMRYLAKDSNLCGSDEWENLQIDIIVGTLMDLNRGITQ